MQVHLAIEHQRAHGRFDFFAQRHRAARLRIDEHVREERDRRQVRLALLEQADFVAQARVADAAQAYACVDGFGKGHRRKKAAAAFHAQADGLGFATKWLSSL